MNCRKTFLLTILALFTLSFFSSISYGGRRSILFVNSINYLGAASHPFMVDPAYKKKLEEDGWQVGYCSLRDLTWGKLKRFNVLVLSQHPDVPRANFYKFFENEKELLKQYLDNGGGILLFADLHRGRIYPHLNELLEPYGIKIFPQGIVDDDPEKQRTLKAYPTKAYCTSNILPSPITEGVKEIWYPQQGLLETVTFEADKNWKIVVRGSETAKSKLASEVTGFEKTYDSQPPLVAYREYSKGRMVVFSTHSSWFTLNPYHFMWDDGFFLENGDAYKLLSNIYIWLAQPSLKQGNLGGFKTHQQKLIFDISPRLKESYPKTVERKITGTIRKAVIGVHSNYSGGDYSIKDFADVAKKLGINLLVFTEKPDRMDKDTWLKLVNECKDVSTDDFLVLPGIHFTGHCTGNEGVVFNLKKPWYDIPFEGKAFTTYARIGVNNAWASNLACVNPTKAPMSIYNLGTVNSHMLFCYDVSELTDVDTETYLKTSAQGWSLAPQVYTEIHTPDELKQIEDNYFTYFHSNVWGKNYDTGKNSILNSFVSNGPIIDYVKLKTPHMWVEPRDRIVKFSFKTHSDIPIRKVSAFINGRLIRNFYPHQKVFEESFEYKTNSNLCFNIVVEDEQGRVAYSKSLPDGRAYYSHFIGGDRMNGYWYPTTPTKPDNAHLKLSGKYAVLGTSMFPGWGWGDQLPIRSGTQNSSHPLGLETGPPTGGLKEVVVTPVVYFSGGAEFPASAPYRRVSLNSTDCVVMRDDVKKLYTHKKDDQTGILKRISPESEYIDAYVVTTAYRCPGTFLMTIETTIEVKKDFTINPKKENFIIRIPFGGYAEDYQSIVYKVKGESVKIIDFEYPKTIELDDAGFVSVIDNRFGVGAIYCFQPAQFSVNKYFNKPSISVFPKLEDENLKKGQKIHTKYLMVLTQGDDGEPVDIFETIFDNYGLDGSPSYQIDLSRGTVLDDVLFPELQADDYGIVGTFSQTKLPTGLGLKIVGLNPNWDAVLYDIKLGRLLRNISIDENVGYVNLDVSKDREIFAGNLITSEDENLIINVFRASEKELNFAVHNPTEEVIEATIYSASAVGIPKVDEKIKIKPSETKFFAGEQ